MPHLRRTRDSRPPPILPKHVCTYAHHYRPCIRGQSARALGKVLPASVVSSPCPPPDRIPFSGCGQRMARGRRAGRSLLGYDCFGERLAGNGPGTTHSYFPHGAFHGTFTPTPLPF